MAANKTVIVLTPNGRRQHVKITLNTTILQILEEVCQKQGYNVDDYDIKHFRQILDPNMIFRFTGLPNNAQLEMVTCTKARSTSNVIIGIQTEDGERKTREYSVNTTLAQALIEIYPESDLERAVLIYMHREVCGKEALEKTTLKSLGLNSGKAILRLIYRDLQQLKTQAHVSTPLLPKPIAVVNDATSSKISQQMSSSNISYCNKITDKLHSSTKSTSEIKNQQVSDEQEIDLENQKVDTARNKHEEIDMSVTKEDHSIVSNCKNFDNEKDQTTKAYTDVNEAAYKIEFLGERNALVFNQANTKALPRDELPDSFFELDVNDAKTLLRDVKRRREELEDAPLITEAQRRLDRDKQTLIQLNKYRRTVIRIQFPDQFVLQALFEPLESVQTVKNFIKDYLDDPNCEFIIYTAPPKHILKSDARLIDENLVPSAILYYSGQSLLKPTIKAKLTDPKAAGIEAVKSRIATMRKEEDQKTKQNTSTTVESGSNVTPRPSGSQSTN